MADARNLLHVQLSFSVNDEEEDGRRKRKRRENRKAFKCTEREKDCRQLSKIIFTLFGDDSVFYLNLGYFC